MGGTFTHLYGSQTEIATSDIIQFSSSTCRGEVTSNISNNIITLNGVRGDVFIVQKATNTADCIINNNMDGSIINTLVSQAQQAYTDQESLLQSLIGIDFSALDYSDTTIQTIQTAVVSNRVSQTLNTSCVSISNLAYTGNIVTLTDVVGNVFLGVDSNNNASCSMANTAKISIMNELSQSLSQTVKRINALIAIVIAIVILIAIVAIAAILIKSISGRKASGEVTDSTAVTEDTTKNKALQIISDDVTDTNDLSGLEELLA
jgi:hypothetical protein